MLRFGPVVLFFFALALLAACGGARAGTLRIETFDGEVATVRDGKLSEAKRDAALRAGDAIRLERGEAVLTAEGLRGTLFGPGRVEAVRTGRGRSAFAVGAGVFRIVASARRELQSPGGHLSVGAPSAALLVLAPGEYWISVSSDGASLFGVASGQAAIRTGTRPPQELAHGEEVEISPDGAMGRVHRRIVRDASDAGYWLMARAEGLPGRQADLAEILRGQAGADRDRFHRLAETMEGAVRGASRGDASRGPDIATAATLALTRRAAAEYLAGVLDGFATPRDDSRTQRRAVRALERLEKALE